MSADDPLQDNIRRTAAIHALKQMRDKVAEENANDAFKAKVLHWWLRYGWWLLLLLVVLIARLAGGI